MEGGWWRGRSHDEEAAVAFKLFLPLLRHHPETALPKASRNGVFTRFSSTTEGPKRTGEAWSPAARTAEWVKLMYNTAGIHVQRAELTCI